jgi:hypothetical protein
MKKLIFLVAAVILTQAINSQTWNYLGNPKFALGADPDITVYNGTVYVAFRDNANGQQCTVMKYDGTDWVTVGNAGFSVDEINIPSIEINSLGEIFVAYKDYNKFNRPTIMKYDGTNWNVLGYAGFGGATADYIDLTLKNDTPVVAFQKNADGVVVMKYNGPYFGYVGNTSAHQLNISSGRANYIDIEVNNNNELLVAHRNILAFTQFATVRKWDGADWGDEANPNFSTGDIAFTTLAIDKATNTPYIAYKDQSSANNGALVVMKSDGSSWLPVGNPMDTVSGTVDDMEIRFFNGQPYVAFLEYSNTSYNASVITYNGTKWEYVGNSKFNANADKLKMVIDEANGKMYVVFMEGGGNWGTSVMTYDLGAPSTTNIIENQKIASNINIYPNPSNGVFEFSSNENIEKIVVYNELGMVVLNQNPKNSKVAIDLTSFSNGIYFVQTTIAGKIYNHKLIKN